MTRRCTRTYVLACRCQRCGKKLARRVHLPPWTGIYCGDCCPACHREAEPRWTAEAPEAVTTDGNGTGERLVGAPGHAGEEPASRGVS